jgi:hypothetical protein
VDEEDLGASIAELAQLARRRKAGEAEEEGCPLCGCCDWPVWEWEEFLDLVEKRRQFLERHLAQKAAIGAIDRALASGP